MTNSQLSYSSSSLPNNSIITSYTGYLSRSYRSKNYRRMGFYCCSNSTSGYAGSFIGLNGNTYSRSGQISVQRFSSSSSVAGCMYIYLEGTHHYQNYLSSSDEGIYACRMPDSAGRNIDVSVGIYRRGYTSELYTYSDWHTTGMLQFNFETCWQVSSEGCTRLPPPDTVIPPARMHRW